MPDTLVDRVLLERLDPRKRSLIQEEGKVEAVCVIITTSVFDGEGIASEPLHWILLRVIIGDPQWFQFLREE
jgi:hypothetical protein